MKLDLNLQIKNREIPSEFKNVNNFSMSKENLKVNFGKDCFSIPCKEIETISINILPEAEPLIYLMRISSLFVGNTYIIADDMESIKLGCSTKVIYLGKSFNYLEVHHFFIEADIEDINKIIHTYKVLTENIDDSDILIDILCGIFPQFDESFFLIYQHDSETLLLKQREEDEIDNIEPILIYEEIPQP